MKILFFLPSLNVGGLERVLVSIANALAKRGHSITIMTYTEGDELAQELDSAIEFIYRPRKPFPIMRKIPYIRNRFYDDGQWETRAAPEQLHKYYIGNKKYDAEIAFFRGMSVKVISGSPNLEAMKLAWVHSDYKLSRGYFFQFRSMRHVRRAYDKMNRIVAVSKQAANSFCEVIGDKYLVETIYNLMPADEIRAKSDQKISLVKKGFTVAAVGRLVPAKGFDRLLYAVKTLNLEGLKFELWIIGDGAEKDKLSAFIKENDLKNVHLLGKQKNPYKYISKSDLLVCSSRYEGYNLTVAEALILGIPVLSTNCTGPSEILDNGKYGMLVENSAEDLIDGLRKIIHEHEIYDHYREMTNKRQEFFNETKIIAQIEELFERR